MPSFLEREQIQSIQPFIADANSILSTFQTKMEYWKQGMASAKSAYQNYLNLELSHSENQGRLDNFMKTAKQQLQKVAQTDLSVGDNQAIAMSIFDPILKDDNIKGDNKLTTFFKDQYQLAESYKTKDNGKYYSANNQNWMLKQLSDFSKDNASNWKNHWNQRDGYSPYIDLSEKVQKIMKDYVPPKFSVTQGTLKGGQTSPYLTTQSSTGFADAEARRNDIRRYIMANLDEKDKHQFMIDGMMRFGTNDDSLRDFALQTNVKTTTNLVDESDRLKAELKGLTDPTLINLQNMKIKANADELDEANKLNKELIAGNMDYVKNNRRSIAERLYTKLYLDNESNGYLNYKYEQNYDMKENPVWKTTFEEAGRNSRNAADNATTRRGQDMTLEGVKIKAATDLAVAGLDENGQPKGPKLTPTNTPVGVSDNSVNTLSEMYKAKDEYQGDLANAEDLANARVAELNGMSLSKFKEDPNFKSTTQAWLAQNKAIADEIAAELAKDPKAQDKNILAKSRLIDPNYTTYTNALQAANIKNQNASAYIKGAEVEFKKIPGLGEYEAIKLPDGSYINAVDVAAGFAVERNKHFESVGDGKAVPGALVINGKRVNLMPQSGYTNDQYRYYAQSHGQAAADALRNRDMAADKFNRAMVKMYTGIRDKFENDPAFKTSVNEVRNRFLKDDQYYNFTSEKVTAPIRNAFAPVFGIDAKKLNISESNQKNKFTVSFKDMTEAERKAFDGKDFTVDNEGNQYKITKISGEGADARYQVQYKNRDANLLNNTNPIHYNAQVGQQVKALFDNGVDWTEPIKMGAGSSTNFKFQKVSSTDELTPDYYKVWLVRPNMPNIEIKNPQGVQFYDFASAWDFTHALANTGANVTEQTKNLNDYLTQIGY